MRVQLFGLSDVGKRREKNEDSFLISESLQLCMVADGMGGHLGGEFASRMASRTVEEILTALENDPDQTLEEGSIVKPGDFASYLRFAIAEASSRIYKKAATDGALRGMGTTTVAALFRKNMAYIANVGDSRAYRIRAGDILQVTRDHSLVGEQIRAGFLSADDARGHRLKNIITRSVGFQESVEADIDIRATLKGDRFLLCSDGLSNQIDDREIGDVVTRTTPRAACQRLVDIANERGGDDNITVIIAEVMTLDPQTTRDASEETTQEAS